jgi:predicted RNA-binding Zn-ribbon protein involved in translation (DUF1610 family)
MCLYKTIVYLLLGDNMEHIFTFKMMVLRKRPDKGLFFSKDNLSQSTKMEPFMSGKGFLNYNCGECGHSMLKSINRIQITDAVYKCPKCSSFNQVKV